MNAIAEMQGQPCRWMRGRGDFGFEVSDEFKDDVINIAKNDKMCRICLIDGYNITEARPIIKTIVERDGSIVMKATGAIIMLKKMRQATQL